MAKTITIALNNIDDDPEPERKKTGMISSLLSRFGIVDLHFKT
ncbi:hypothetical protein HMPREF9412_0558 [Paenibacillus sp. HGF5]|nr:hypothetical protein HMPREF9412_0558 [Paenibacillus sp. HGF5]